MLNKQSLQKNIKKGLQQIYLDQAKLALEGKEDENPEDAIERITEKMASIITDAIDKYIKEGEIIVDDKNILVTTSSGPAKVTSLIPANII